MKIQDIDKTKLTPMIRQYVDIKLKNPEIIVFFRLGDFYEMFFEDAILVSKKLEITLTGRNAGLKERIPMCGVPHHAAAVYIEKLVGVGYRVGICEQMEDPNEVKGIVKREIVKIVSKGTITDDNALFAKDNNFIGSLNRFKDLYVLTYTDISTGDIYLKEIPDQKTTIINEILNISLQELVIEKDIPKEISQTLKEQYQMLLTEFNEEITDFNKANEVNDARYQKSINFLLSYINYTQNINPEHLKKININKQTEILKMDVHTKRNLELTETKRLKQRQHSLLWLLDKTKTAMGARLLKRYIESPIVNQEKLERRYFYVEALIKQFLLKKEIEELLKEVYDLERLSGKVAFANCNARDLIQLKKSLAIIPQLNDIFKKLDYDRKLTPVNDLYNLLDKSLQENPPISIKEGNIIKENYHSKLDELKELRRGGKDFIAEFELQERKKTGIKNLKVGYNRVFGYYIEVSKANVHLVKDEYNYDRKQTLSNCERYISPILKEKEALILNAEEKIIELEHQLFLEIREEVKKYISVLQNNSDIISEIDVFQSFAVCAEENNYVKPKISQNIEIKESRHPIIEKVSDFQFVPNDIILNEKVDIQLITGPNMAGKSTYLRQMALTTIMAQIGSFVPANEANLPIIDAIYTRIGSSDDIIQGDSTFMVEMNEANYALKNATKNSLILFDELGRGTATFDGIAITQAIIEYLHDYIGAKVLFSTHYHELTDLENHLKKLENIHMSAVEENGKLTFLYKIKRGSVDRSYGIHVAKLANMPYNLIERANDILTIYEQTDQKRDAKINQKVIVEKSKIAEEIKNLDLQTLTPLDALNLIAKWQRKEK